MKKITKWFRNILKPKLIKKRFIDDYEFNEIRWENNNKLNLILDKISKKKKLTKKEKDFLNKYANK
jgi:hypothetical protein